MTQAQRRPLQILELQVQLRAWTPTPEGVATNLTLPLTGLASSARWLRPLHP